MICAATAQEATAWKIIQRIMGTLLGGTLGYLIMLVIVRSLYRIFWSQQQGNNVKGWYHI